MLIVNPSKLRPPLWAVNPGIIAYNASRLELPMLENFYMWGGGDRWVDQGKKGNDGTLAGDAVWQGNSVYLAGSDDYVNLGLWSGAGSVTLFAVINFEEGIANTEQITAADSSNDGERTFQFRRTSTGKLEFIVFVGGAAKTVTGATTLTTGVEWYITAVNDGTNAHVYVNGYSDATPIASGAMDNDPAAWAIGVRPANTNFANLLEDLQGFVKVLHRWDVALNSSQVAILSADPYGLVQQPRRMWAVEAAVAGLSIPVAMHHYQFNLGK